MTSRLCPRSCTVVALCVTLSLGLSAYADSVTAAFSQPSADAMQIEIAGGEVVLYSVANGMVPTVEGCVTFASPGDPAIPCRELRVALPPDVDLESVALQVNSLETETLLLEGEIAPVPPYAFRDGTRTVYSWGDKAAKTIDNGRNTRVYGADALYPAQVVELLPPAQLRKWKIACIRFYPVQYNPQTGELHHTTHVSITLTYQVLPGSQQKAAALADPAGDEAAQRIVDNYDQAQAAYAAPKAAPKQGVNFDYVIITTEDTAFNSATLKEFEQLREAEGFNVVTVTENRYYPEIGGSWLAGGWGGGVGDTAAENLRSFLQLRALPWGIEYVLLIGSPHPLTGDVPMKIIHPRDPSDENTPTDFYYAELTGNWDLNGDGSYGTFYGDYNTANTGIDWAAELNVGRIPVYSKNYTDLDKIMRKIIAYDLEDGNLLWRRKVLLPMEPSDQYTPGYSLGEGIKNDFLTPNGWASLRIYEEDYGCSPELTPCNPTNVLNVWKNAYGLVTWWTHGSETSASGIFAVSSCPQLNDAKPSFTFQCSCNNGWPEVTNNLGYSLLKRGAVSTVSATRVSMYAVGEWRWKDDANSTMAYYYSGGLVNGMRAGEALNYTRSVIEYHGYESWRNATVFTLYGDPAMRLDADPPHTWKFDTTVSSLSASAEVGETPDDITFGLLQSGITTRVWSLTDSASWLSVTPAAGTLGDFVKELTVSFDTTGLAVGTYNATITITTASPGCMNAPYQVPVALSIGLPPPPPPFTLEQALDDAELAWTCSGNSSWFAQRTTTRDGVDAAQSGAVGTNQQSLLSTQVEGPGTLSFSWKVSSHPDPRDGGCLTFLMDSVAQQRIYGEKEWATVTFVVPPGPHDLTWQYKRGHLTGASADCGWLDSVAYARITETPYLACNPSSIDTGCKPGENPPGEIIRIRNAGGGSMDYTVSANRQWVDLSATSGTVTSEEDEILVSFDVSWLSAPTATATILISAPTALNGEEEIAVTITRSEDYLTLGEAVDAPELPWSTEGKFNWRATTSNTHDGVDAAVGRNTIPYIGESILKTTVTGPGTLTFWWKPTCEFARDYGAFRINGGIRISAGESADWSQETVSIPAGTHELSWLFHCGQTYSDATGLYLDQVNYRRPQPLIGLSVDAVAAQCQPGQDAPDATFEIWNSGDATLRYVLTSQQSWLSFSPERGSSNGGHDIITVHFDTSGLEMGRYNGAILISSMGGASDGDAPARSVPVTLDVGDRHKVTLTPAKDTTVYEHATSELSNGAGEYVIVGVGSGMLRHGLMYFDVAASIPADAVVDYAELELVVDTDNREEFGCSLTRLTRTFGEAGSQATRNELDGAPAETGDASWRYASYDDTLWTSPGGDCVAEPSATVGMSDSGVYTIGPADAMAADVQTWLRPGKFNHGWLLRPVPGPTAPTSAKRIASRQNTTPENRPKLHIAYYTQAPVTVATPDVLGDALADAEAAIAAANLDMGTITREYSASPKDTVLAQTPAAGTLLIVGSDVDLTVSDGPAPVAVPDVVGLDHDDAQSAIIAAGLTLTAARRDFSTYAVDVVCLQSPLSGAVVAPGSEVELTVSKGVGDVTVPDVTGLAQASAGKLLRTNWLVVGEVLQESSTTVSPGKVIRQSPAAGGVATMGSAVDFTVSSGPPTTVVPDVFGLSESAAQDALIGSGLSTGTVTHAYSSRVPIGCVMYQAPEANATVVAGTSVNLVISDGPAQITMPNVLGMDRTEAIAAVQSAGFALEILCQASTEPIDTVIVQSPPAGATVAEGTFVQITVSILRGDVNGDGSVNATDLQIIINNALGISSGETADIDGDGLVDAIDIQLEINILLGLIKGALPGELLRDGTMHAARTGGGRKDERRVD